MTSPATPRRGIILREGALRNARGHVFGEQHGKIIVEIGEDRAPWKRGEKIALDPGEWQEGSAFWDAIKGLEQAGEGKHPEGKGVLASLWDVIKEGTK